MRNMTATAITWWGAGQNWWSFMDKYGGKRHKKTDVHITLDQDVLQRTGQIGRREVSFYQQPAKGGSLWR